MSLVPVKRTPFIVADAARNASLPNGSRPGTIKIISSAIRLRTVSMSPVSLAFIHVATKSRIARSSSVMAPLSNISFAREEVIAISSSNCERSTLALDEGQGPIRVDFALLGYVRFGSKADVAYKLLIEKGLIRIAIPLPGNIEVVDVDDPYGCTTNPVTGLQPPTMGMQFPTMGILSMYRRPLPSTNLGFDTEIMWDGREPSFQHQAVDAILGHAEGKPP